MSIITYKMSCLCCTFYRLSRLQLAWNGQMIWINKVTNGNTRKLPLCILYKHSNEFDYNIPWYLKYFSVLFLCRLTKPVNQLSFKCKTQLVICSMLNLNNNRQLFHQKVLGPVVQSIISLTSSLVVKILTVLVSSISNSQIFLLKKNVSSFCKSCSHFFSKNISVYAKFNDQSFNNKLTNDTDSFEQPGPDNFLNSPWTCVLLPLVRCF